MRIPDRCDIRVDAGCIKVEQGPEWLARLLYDPPSFVEIGVFVIAIVVVGLAYLGYRNVNDDANAKTEVSIEMAQNALVVVFALLLTSLLVEVATLPYVLDVALGGGGGWLAAMVLTKATRRAMNDEPNTPL